MTTPSFRQLQNAVQKVEYVSGEAIPYVHFSRYGRSSEAAEALKSSLEGLVTVQTVVEIATDDPRFQKSVLSELGATDSKTLSTPVSAHDATVEFLRIYNRACIDAFVHGRMYELASAASTPQKADARKRAVGLVRRGIEQNGLSVSPPEQPPLDDTTTVEVLAWGRVLGVPLTFEDIYALCVTSASWRDLVDTSTSSSGIGRLLQRISSYTAESSPQPLHPLPALPEPEDRPALPE